MKLEIRKYGDPALRLKGKPVAEVDDRIRELADNMLETMRAANGIGLAAFQAKRPVWSRRNSPRSCA
jgi:peptide deformylase